MQLDPRHLHLRARLWVHREARGEAETLADLGETIVDVQPIWSALGGGATVTLKGRGFHDFWGRQADIEPMLEGGRHQPIRYVDGGPRRRDTLYNVSSTLRCKFGDVTVVPATLTVAATNATNFTTVECVAPKLSALRPLRTFVGIDEAFGGDGAPDTLHIMGDAYVDGGVLKLTDAAVLKAGGKNGWLLFNLPPPRPALWQWRIEFDVYVGGGTGGEGFSVVYGPLPDLYALEFQGGISHMGPSTTHDFLGLSVMFQTVRSGKIWVKYDDVTLKYIEVGTVLRSAQWMHVEIEVVELVSKNKEPVYGVTIVHDGWSSWAEGKSTAEIVDPGVGAAGGVALRDGRELLGQDRLPLDRQSEARVDLARLGRAHLPAGAHAQRPAV